MRLRHIEVFHAVYSSGSVTRAARLLNVSQPSISKVLAHAELQLGFKLFERRQGKLTPTPEAVRLYDHVCQVYSEITTVRRVAENLREASSGGLRIGCTPAMGVELVPCIVAQFIQHNQAALLEVETLHLEEIRDALVESRLDIAIAFDAHHLPGLSVRTVATGRFVLIAPPGLATELPPTIDLSQLPDLPFIRLNTRGPLGQLLDSQFQAVERQPRVVAATETYQVARALVAQGMGISIVDEITAKAGDPSDVSIIQIEPTLTFDVNMFHLEQTPPSLLAQNFMEHASPMIKNYISS